MEPVSKTHPQYIGGRIRRGISALMLALIDAYRFLLSPLIGQHCRFHPSCSLYARAAIETHGPLTGLWLTLGRLLRCHPWCAGGIDPVPGSKESRAPDAPSTPEKPC